MGHSQGQLPSRDLLHSEGQLEMGAAMPLTATEADALLQTRISSPRKDAWRRFHRNRAAMISLGVILVLVLMAMFAPFMHTSDPIQPSYGLLDSAPSGQHWFGTDGVGRDQYSRLIYGLRVPLSVGLLGTAITAILGTLLGIASGYFGGVVDSILARFTDIMFAFPAFLFALIVVSLFGKAFDPYFGGSGRVTLLTVVFALVSWPPLMRFVRSLALALKEQQFIEAARTSGTNAWRIMVRHLLPNMWGVVLVQASFIVVAVISTETLLSIFGLGVETPNPDLGQMLYDGVQHLQYDDWELVFPALFLTVLILAFTFVGDGVRDAVDPRGAD